MVRVPLEGEGSRCVAGEGWQVADGLTRLVDVREAGMLKATQTPLWVAARLLPKPLITRQSY